MSRMVRSEEEDLGFEDDGEDREEREERERLCISVQRMGRPRPTDEIPPHEAKKSPRSFSSTSCAERSSPLTPLTLPP